ncbi:uncharacterized protein LOC113313868 [Papaver somniferum]|uniref:uncharacterized protein LOC113313868 n=1 Tax=Papaver somniferum TaxID=3469 RepID=UPI000E700641|nr:uncharacterized protein LOC113313868 [Papaver somniferum]XP_026418436.1 uncharacterized protein LOC113313868 [Papaver somniferum]
MASLFFRRIFRVYAHISSTKSSLSSSTTLYNETRRTFRSKAALESLITAAEEKTSNLILYNYPSFSGSYSALFAQIYYTHLQIPHLILPFSSVEPFRVEDLNIGGTVDTCYLLDFVGPKGFTVKLSKVFNRVIVFDHSKLAMSKVPSNEECPDNLELNINVHESSSKAVYNYFLNKLLDTNCTLVRNEDRDRIETLLKYIEDGELNKWNLPDTRAFDISLKVERRKLNCITNPYMFDQLMQLDPTDLITRGNAYISSRQNAANKLLDKPFKIHLGRGFYGECLGIRADGNANLSDEIGKELSLRSAAAGLRPIGAVIYMQRKNLKMCLRSNDSSTDTSEIAKAYGGGGTSASSSFIIRMDEYNEWVSGRSRKVCKVFHEKTF